MSTKLLNQNLKTFFPNPSKPDRDHICIYSSKLDNGNIRELTRLANRTIQKLYGNSKKTIRCCITGKELIVYNNYPLLDGILMKSSKKYFNYNHISISRRCKLYPISTEGLHLIDSLNVNTLDETKKIINQCKYGRIYKEGVLLRFLGSDKHSMLSFFNGASTKHRAVLTTQRFYKNIVKPHIEEHSRLFNESFCDINDEVKDMEEVEVEIEGLSKEDKNSKKEKGDDGMCTIC